MADSQDADKQAYPCRTLERALLSRKQLGQDFINGTIDSDTYVTVLGRLTDAVDRFQGRTA